MASRGLLQPSEAAAGIFVALQIPGDPLPLLTFAVIAGQRRAVELALALAEGDGDRIAIVQFHPATTYEDFFEGCGIM
jgi:hypothetical protein